MSTSGLINNPKDNQPSGCDKTGNEYCGLFDGEAAECYYREETPEGGLACTHPINLYKPEEDVDEEEDETPEDAAYLSC